MTKTMQFEFVGALLLLPLPLIIYRLTPGYYIQRPALYVPFFSRLTSQLNLTPQQGAQTLTASYWQRFSLILGWILLVIAIAKPVWLDDPQTREITGRDLMVAVDLSGSMNTSDYIDQSGLSVSRFMAVKSVLTDFSKQREGDRLGLILFADAAYLQSPFTLDHAAWLSLLQESDVSMAGESTHLGDAIGLTIKTFNAQKESSKNTQLNRQKVAIILTDGNDTDSLVPPIDAAKIAAANNIRLYVIAIGNANTTGEQALDLQTIQKIASLTGGQSFLANSPATLQAVTNIISETEPQLINSYSFQPKISLHHLPIILILINHLIFMFVSTLVRLRKNQTGNQHVI